MKMHHQYDDLFIGNLVNDLGVRAKKQVILIKIR
jgi:hypothetical protein